MSMEHPAYIYFVTLLRFADNFFRQNWFRNTSVSLSFTGISALSRPFSANNSEV